MSISSILGLLRRCRREGSAQRLGQYILGPKIGEGGMGAVYRARHAAMKRTVAIKMLGEQTDGTGEVRFEREAQLTSRLYSPNIVSVYDYGRTPGGTPYYVMEYVDGYDLETLVAKFGALPPGRAVHLLKQVCAALADVHEAGLVHRDVKPSNVALTERAGVHDVVKVLDFGLVKQLGARQRGPSSTGTNALVGTPNFLAPEAITAPAGVDARSDIYAVGGLAYFLLTGTPVFAAESVIEVCIHHVQSGPEPPSARLGERLPHDVEALVLRCLEKDPARRPQSARELHAALDACECASDWTNDEATRWWLEHRPFCSTTKDHDHAEAQHDPDENSGSGPGRCVVRGLRGSLARPGARRRHHAVSRHPNHA